MILLKCKCFWRSYNVAQAELGTFSNPTLPTSVLEWEDCATKYSRTVIFKINLVSFLNRKLSFSTKFTDTRLRSKVNVCYKEVKQ